jgi:hypothetical protein
MTLAVAACPEPAPAGRPIDTINPILGDASFIEACGRPPTADDDQQLRVRTHLAYVEARLRRRDVGALSHAQRASRATLLDSLHRYLLAGQFPAGAPKVGYLPTFIDGRGVRCAVAMLVEQTAGAATVTALDRAFHNAFIAQIDSSELDDWVTTSGFTRDEVVMIQPTYQNRSCTGDSDDDYAACLLEFERMYELHPSYKILYNMGRIQRMQKDHAGAMRSYTRYLRDGADAIAAERRKEVEAELVALESRVARLRVTVNVDGADVYANDVPACYATLESPCTGKSPLASPILVNKGRHKITATKKGHHPAVSLVSVSGFDALDVRLDLVSYDRLAPKDPPNPWMLPAALGWSAAAVVAIGGLSALALDDEQKNLAGLSEGLFITAGAFALASTYFTIRMLGSRTSITPVSFGTF